LEMNGLPPIFREIDGELRLKRPWRSRFRHARKTLESGNGVHAERKAGLHRGLIPAGIHLSRRGAFQLREGKVLVLAIDGFTVVAEVVSCQNVSAWKTMLWATHLVHQSATLKPTKSAT
jgi:hypothetical protein